MLFLAKTWARLERGATGERRRHLEVLEVVGGAGQPEDDAPVGGLHVVGHDEDAGRGRGRHARHEHAVAALALQHTGVEAPRRAGAPVGQVPHPLLAGQTRPSQPPCRQQQHVDEHDGHREKIRQQHVRRRLERAPHCAPIIVCRTAVRL